MMGGEAKEIRRVMNAALTNPLIAERILNQAEFEEKKELRLVSKFWRDSTLKEWRQSVTLPLHFEQDEYYYSSEGRQFLTVKSFDGIMEGRVAVPGKILRIHDMPFRRLILHGHNSVSGYPRIPPEEIFEQVVHFLAKFGSTLECLKLEWLRVSHPFFENLMRGILRLCPKLKELVISDCVTWLPKKDALTDYDSLLKAFSLSLQLLPEREASKLTKLTIEVSEEMNDTPELLQFWENFFYLLPNLKVLKYEPGKRSVFWYGTEEYLITGALTLPLTKFPNGKYLELEELDLPFDLREEFSPGYEEFPELGTFLEVAQPPLKKLRIALHFDCNEIEGIQYANEMSSFHQFCIVHGHRLTELKISIAQRCYWDDDEFQWINFLTGHYFPNLTHFTIACFHRDHQHEFYGENGRVCIPGKINFDFEALKGMPRLQVFHCFEGIYDQDSAPEYELTPAMLKLEEHGVMPWSEGQEINEVYENQLELKELQEFLFHSSTDEFDEDSLKMVLGWMKNLKKLTLHLNKDTLPIVFETLPDLDKLTLLGMSCDEVTEAEFLFKTIWMDEMSRARQEKEWRNMQKRNNAKAELGEVEVLRREAEKEKRERRRTEMEREEKEWIGDQGKEEGEWNYVSYRKRQPLPRLPPRQSHKSQSDPDLDDVSVISEILKWKNKTSVLRT